jgi:hypothetical protein
MRFLYLDCVGQAGAFGLDADDVAERTRTDLLEELVFFLDLLLHA